MKPEFFAETNNGRITLTFHFWSGRQLTCYVSKTGTTVSGATS